VPSETADEESARSRPRPSPRRRVMGNSPVPHCSMKKGPVRIANLQLADEPPAIPRCAWPAVEGSVWFRWLPMKRCEAKRREANTRPANLQRPEETQRRLQTAASIVAMTASPGA
jgi:hypothetical protein